MEADEGLKLQLQVCLTLLQRSFKEFLDKTIQQHEEYPQSRPKKGENWFESYKAWFWAEAAIQWDDAPVSPVRMEELTIARNCIQHGGEARGDSGDVFDSHRLLKSQSVNYHKRFPDAFFADEFESNLWKEHGFSQPVTINLTPEKLEVSIADILAFCRFIDDHLPSWMC